MIYEKHLLFKGAMVTRLTHRDVVLRLWGRFRGSAEAGASLCGEYFDKTLFVKKRVQQYLSAACHSFRAAMLFKAANTAVPNLCIFFSTAYATY
jgi:hypothetical protein